MLIALVEEEDDCDEQVERFDGMVDDMLKFMTLFYANVNRKQWPKTLQIWWWYIGTCKKIIGNNKLLLLGVESYLQGDIAAGWGGWVGAKAYNLTAWHKPDTPGDEFIVAVEKYCLYCDAGFKFSCTLSLMREITF